jgi:hypothetical protein
VGGRVGRSRQPSRPPASRRAGPAGRRGSPGLAHRSARSGLRPLRGRRLAALDPRLLSSGPPSAQPGPSRRARPSGRCEELCRSRAGIAQEAWSA